MKWDSSFSKECVSRVDDWGLILCRGRNFSLLHQVQTAFEVIQPPI
jgi:hypothetical protein